VSLIDDSESKHDLMTCVTIFILLYDDTNSTGILLMKVNGNILNDDKVVLLL